MKLYEIAAVTSSQLSLEQKECLLRLYMSKDVHAIAGDVKLMAAAEHLVKVGMLTPEMQVTRIGQGQLSMAGLLDASGPTDEARELLDQPSAKAQKQTITPGQAVLGAS